METLAGGCMVRVARPTILPPISKTFILVTANVDCLITVEPYQVIDGNHNHMFHIAFAVMDMLPGRAFNTVVLNTSKIPARLDKH